MAKGWLGKYLVLLLVLIGGGVLLRHSVMYLAPTVAELTPTKNVFWERQKTLYQELIDSGLEVSFSGSSGLGPVLGLIRTAALWLPQGDANPSDVLEGRTFYSKNSRSTQTGTIPLREGANPATDQTATTEGVSLTVPHGYYGGSDEVTVTNQQLANLAPDLTANNLLLGKTIFGIQGNIPLKTGDTASTNQATAGGVIYLTSPYGYYSGSDRVFATNAQISALDPNLVSTNILSGVSIFGVNGSIPLKTGDNASTNQATAGGLVYLTAPEGYYDGNDRVSATNAQIVALDPNLLAGNIITGVTIFGVTGTYPNPTGCVTEVHFNPNSTETASCSLTWGAPTTPVTGDDNRAGRGPKDPRTGLIWSKYLKNNAGTVEFADSGGSTWTWDGTTTFTVTSANATAGATYTNNGQTFTVVTTITAGTSLNTTATGAPAASGTLTKTSGTGDATITFSAASKNATADGNKTASQLCSERGSGWRLPTHKEFLQAYIDGNYWNLSMNGYYYFWAATESSVANALTTENWSGATRFTSKAGLYYVRCVRSE